MTRGTEAPPAASARQAPAPAQSPAELLEEAGALERSGSMQGAVDLIHLAVAAAEGAGEAEVLARAFRRLAVLSLRLGDKAGARSFCERSHTVARAAGNDVLAAEALNVRAGLEFEAGRMGHARQTYGEALALGGADETLRARIEQNLGILANIQGDLDGALGHYQHSLEAYRRTGDLGGQGLAFHNLGMMSADREQWDDADRYFSESAAIARRLGDGHLEALCRLNHSEVHLARQRYDQAMSSAEQALQAFERQGSALDKADAYRAIGMVYRETGRLGLAEARLTTARVVAAQAGSMLSEAEASRELALVYQAMGRNQDALSLLTGAHRLFSSLDARLDLVDVTGRREKLEATYLAVVRDWGQSIESSDSYTFGHCERVAAYAVAVAEGLGLDEATRTTIRLGAYLHDVGKIRVPHEILNKPGRLTPQEFETIKRHPQWGVELLESVEFPWDLKPIIRWHHEKHDGTGYPDGLRGDAIPLSAQILCVVDVYDALTTTRSYRPALSHEAAIAQMLECRSWWRSDVFTRFLDAVPAPAA